MTTALVLADHIVKTEGDWLIDSRVLAVQLDYEHETVVRNIQRHKARLEAKSVVRQLVGKPPKGSSGGRPEVYYMLCERQSLILAGSLKKGVEADEWHDALVDAFLQARAQVRHLEAQQPQPQAPTRTLKDTLRGRLSANKQHIPADCFTIDEVALRHLEALLDAVSGLDTSAMLEQSIAQRFARYAKEDLHMPEEHRRRYSHVLPNGRVVQAWAYDRRYLPIFVHWLWTVYFPQHFPDYARYRARYIGLPAPKESKRLPARTQRFQVIQQPFAW